MLYKKIILNRFVHNFILIKNNFIQVHTKITDFNNFFCIAFRESLVKENKTIFSMYEINSLPYEK